MTNPVGVPASHRSLPGSTGARPRPVWIRPRALADRDPLADRYRSLFNHATFGIYISTESGRFLDVNPALVRMLGYDAIEEVLALNLEHDVYYTPGERARCIFEHPQGPRGAEVRWRRKDGHTITVRLVGRRVEGDDPEPTYEVIVEDVTQHRELEHQLRQAQKLESVALLATGVAHDFNNVLTAILGYAELVASQIGPDKPIGDDLHQILQAGQRGADLTRQLLAFSRHQPLRREPLALNDVIASIYAMLTRLIGERIAIRSVLGDDLGVVIADQTQIVQVIMNLVVNARDAMPDGGTITLSTRRATAGDWTPSSGGAASAVVLSVDDTGVGMTPDLQERIFEPFFTTKAPGRGTGLGLSAVHGIVTQLGGTIRVTSQPGHGTTFSICLPAAARATAVPGPAVAVHPHPGKASVLVVEDEAAVRRLIEATLRRFGYTVLAVSSAEEALAALHAPGASFDLLLSDIVLGGADGVHLAQAVKQRAPGIRIILTSGYAHPVSVPLEEVGATFLQKPFSSATLLSRVSESLTGVC